MKDLPSHLPDERKLITKEDVDLVEQEILQRRHIERYMGISQYAYGTVLDCASGCGYGSYLLSKMNDVEHVHGIEIDAAAVAHANAEFGNPKITFHAASIEDFDQPGDVLVTLETVEHLKDPTILADLCDRSGIGEVVLSYPKKKTTHYNKFHEWDLVTQDIADIFPKFMIVEVLPFAFDTSIVRLIRHERGGAAPKRWGGRSGRLA